MTNHIVLGEGRRAVGLEGQVIGHSGGTVGAEKRQARTDGRLVLVDLDGQHVWSLNQGTAGQGDRSGYTWRRPPPSARAGLVGNGAGRHIHPLDLHAVEIEDRVVVDHAVQGQLGAAGNAREGETWVRK